MQIPESGLSRDALLEQLEAYRAHDVPWRDGRTWAYVYDAGPEAEAVGKAAYMAFLSDNALDPTAFPSLLQLENEVVAMCADHLQAPAGAAGNLTSGGTESCMLAVKAARDRARAERGVVDAELVLPATAHAAFHKACAYFDVRPVVVPVDPISFRAVPEAMAAAVTERTALLVGSAVSYAHGVCDPIPELGALALAHRLPLHVDGCIGGFLLGWWRRMGHPAPPFDFSVPGVTSISMDLHKYAFCPKPSSVLLHRDEALRRYQYFACADWTGYTIVNPTMLSTKSGGPIAAAWAVLRHLGGDGYRRLLGQAWDGTRALLAGLERIDGLEVLGAPDANLIAFAGRGLSIFRVADALRRRGWFVQPQLGYAGSRANIHLSVNPASVGWVDDLLADLAAAVSEVRAAPAPPDLRAAFADLDPKALTPEAFDALLAGAGVQGAALPGEMAAINELLDALPPAVTGELLKRYISGLFSAPR